MSNIQSKLTMNLSILLFITAINTGIRLNYASVKIYKLINFIKRLITTGPHEAIVSTLDVKHQGLYFQMSRKEKLHTPREK